MFRKILICFDGSVGSRRAAEIALSLASEQEAPVLLLSVVEHLPHYSATIGEAEDEYERATSYFEEGQRLVLGRASEQGVASDARIITGNAPLVIVHTAEEGGFDLVVMGHSGHSEIWGRFMGTTADKVTRHAPCSVLIVR